MQIIDALKKVRSIHIRPEAPPVCRTAASRLSAALGGEVEIAQALPAPEPRPGVFSLHASAAGVPERPGLFLRLGDDGAGRLEADAAFLLYGFTCHLAEVLARRPMTPALREGMRIEPAFAWNRPSYDFFLTQEGRIQKGFDKESYVRESARLGFTHVEVNGLAYPMGLETGPKGEIYPMFYTYCPALDQFVSTRLNEGLYPRYYLSANLAALKENAALARKYGLAPGLLCFEPRSVPEAFFDRYPMLRGARVDHPVRSFKPRYNMTIVHPRVREHYAEMVDKLLQEVPELAFLCIWSNDSGAGFEHTKSLYVGRNGGAYLIREWKDDQEIARRAGENALRFLRVLRDAGRARNPEFRVLTRLESFYGEHETVWAGLGDGLDVESASLFARGWDTPYTHPRYPDSRDINAGTLYQQGFDARERPLLGELEARGGRAHFYFSAGPHWMFAPLLGIPYPYGVLRRLKTLREGGVSHLAHGGGTHPPQLVPYNANHEALRRFQFDPSLDADETVLDIARTWVGERHAAALAQAWRLAEEAMLAFPIVTPLYAALGFTWYRLWVRPLVPDYEALTREERAYYEDFMCTTPHNPNNVDLSRDVLFQLTTPAKARRDRERIDQNVWEPLERARQTLRDLSAGAQDDPDRAAVFFDQRMRLRALHGWFMTQRNVAAWIAGVHGYMAARDEAERARCRAEVRALMEKEIENTAALRMIFDTEVAFMALTDRGETPLVHGTNFPELMDRRVRIMQAHMEDEPRIDPDYMERVAGRPLD